MKSYGMVLWEMLKENNITQKELARRIECAPPRISDYVTGKRTPTIETVRRINEAIYWWGDES